MYNVLHMKTLIICKELLIYVFIFFIQSFWIPFNNICSIRDLIKKIKKNSIEKRRGQISIYLNNRLVLIQLTYIFGDQFFFSIFIKLMVIYLIGIVYLVDRFVLYMNLHRKNVLNYKIDQVMIVMLDYLCYLRIHC